MSENAEPQTTPPQDPDDVVLSVKETRNVEMLRIKKSGEVYIKGELAQSDEQIAAGLRAFAVAAIRPDK